jgi:hypothetical protein
MLSKNLCLKQWDLGISHECKNWIEKKGLCLTTTKKAQILQCLKDFVIVDGGFLKVYFSFTLMK